MPRSPLLLILLAASLSVGCRPDSSNGSAASSAAAPTGQQARPAAEPASGRIYDVDAAGSEVLWRISRAGVMARLGHSHVISAEEFTGNVVVDTDDPARSRFELEIPVAALVVDDPELRARFGDEFASLPSEADKAGTKSNMLGDALLNAGMFPVVRVRGGELMGAGDAQTAAIEIDIVGNSFAFRVPAAVTFTNGTLEATGNFALGHAELGLTPFSALGGAMQVGETIEFSYRIRAVEVAADR
jgi:polyisoprenoid-binding protein YceI